MVYLCLLSSSLCAFSMPFRLNGVGAWFRIVSVFIVVSLPTDFPSSRPTLSQWGLEDECVLLKNPKDSNSLVSARLSLSLGVLPLHMGLARVLPRTVWLIGNHVVNCQTKLAYYCVAHRPHQVPPHGSSRPFPHKGPKNHDDHRHSV